MISAPRFVSYFLPFALIGLPVQANPAWMDYTAMRTCIYLELGYSPQKAGYEGISDTLQVNVYKDAAIRAFQLDPDAFAIDTATVAAKRCPKSLMKATRNHTGA